MKYHTFPLPEDTAYVRHGSLERVPANVSNLAKMPATKVPFASIDFKWHPPSQHLSIENFQPPSYYEDYLMTATYSDVLQKLQCSQVERLVSLHDGTDGPRSFVEIGCGDGSFMKYARRSIGRVLGIEPSRRFAAEAQRDGFEVLIGYVGSGTTLTDEKFDSFASRQVFEHLPDPQDVLTGIRKMLNPGAVGLIEVPNGHRALRLKRFFEFFPDHVNYFSVNSLVALASDVGLNAICCKEAFGGDYLELWLRNDLDVDDWFRDLTFRRDEVCGILASKVTELANQSKKVVIWGCGAKTLSILAASPPEMSQKISCIIDSDPHKQGGYVPNTSIPVLGPEKGVELKPDVVFILALSYRAEIASAVRERMPTCRLILTLDDHGYIIEV